MFLQAIGVLLLHVAINMLWSSARNLIANKALHWCFATRLQQHILTIFLNLLCLLLLHLVVLLVSIFLLRGVVIDIYYVGSLKTILRLNLLLQVGFLALAAEDCLHFLTLHLFQTSIIRHVDRSFSALAAANLLQLLLLRQLVICKYNPIRLGMVVDLLAKVLLVLHRLQVLSCFVQFVLLAADVALVCNL